MTDDIYMTNDDVLSIASSCKYNNKHNMCNKSKKRTTDSGLNVIYRYKIPSKKIRPMSNEKNSIVTRKIELFSSGGIGSNIRLADTGQYTSHKVGSKYEDFYYKVNLATGECNGKSNTFFFLSPLEYADHMGIELDQNDVRMWRTKIRTIQQNLEKIFEFQKM